MEDCSCPREEVKFEIDDPLQTGIFANVHAHVRSSTCQPCQMFVGKQKMAALPLEPIVVEAGLPLQPVVVEATLFLQQWLQIDHQ